MNLRFAQRRRKQGWFLRAGAIPRRTALVVALVGHGAVAVADCGRPAGQVYVSAVDERLDVELADGRLVRIGGLDAPSVGRGSPELVKAARDDLAALLVGRQAELVQLATGADRWGRILADIEIPDRGSGDSSTAAALLAAGFARVRPEFETRGCAAARLAIEDAARHEGLGVWSDPAFAVLPATDSARLHDHDGQFVVVEGKVRNVGFSRSRLYLDLGPGGGATIVLARRLEPAFARSGNPVGALVGRTIRARGALDGRFGSRIEVNDPAMIEFVRPPDASGAEDLRP